MTRSDTYIRLEAIGLWQESRDAPPREVIVTLGTATLVLIDLQDRPLGHWALAGIQVHGEADGAFIYSMTEDGAETLTIRDREVIRAIAGAARAASGRSRGRRRPPRHLRFLAPVLTLAALAGLALAGASAIRAQAVRILPQAQAAEFGDQMLLALMETGGGLCRSIPGDRALDRIAARLTPSGGTAPRLRVLDLGGTPVAVLPGKTILLDRGLPAAAETPEELAGWVALGLDRAPNAQLIEAIGPLQDLRFLLTGRIGPAALARAAEASRVPPAAREVKAAIDRLTAAAVAAGPFTAEAERRGLSPEGSKGFMPATAPAPRPLLAPEDWAAVKSICG